MYNHFSSSRRWFYIITSVVGGVHKHYLISSIYDSNSLYNIDNAFNSAYDGYLASLDNEQPCIYSCSYISDTALGNYDCLGGVDTNTLYIVLDRGDYKE